MDRDELIDEIAGCSAEDFASFQRRVLARRTEILQQRLEALSTTELRARGLELLNRANQGMDEQREISRRQTDHMEWIRKLGDDIDDADVALSQDLGKDSDWNANIVVANMAEMTAITTILGNRGANLRDEKGGA
jgi:hypothetical protein